MLGGFLGAGKTTAVAQLGAYLTVRGLRVGLITNDQSTGLVDTKVLRSRGFAVEEIAGGCFCCRFDSLHDAATKLTSESRPDVFIAEPVGSCTDLVATVSYPLRRIYGDSFTIAPLSVLVDPIRAGRILGLEEGRSFSPKVVYVYRKQLEEANLIVINKCDLISEEQRAALEAALREAFPQAEVLSCAAKDGTGLTGWFEKVMGADCGDGATMQIDYDTYAEGEALLGWLNTTIGLTADEPFDGNALLMDLTDRIGRRLKEAGFEIAHLKMTLDANDDAGNLSVVSLVSSDGEPDLRESLLDRTDRGTLIVNLRAEADPNLLEEVTKAALAESAAANGNVTTTLEHSEHFRPGKPTPTHRVEVSA
jgi:G3E family GTPase